MFSSDSVHPTPRTPSSWALLIGINSYPRCPTIQRLNGCINDVALFKGVLTSQFGFPPENIQTLLDAEATQANIFASFSAFVERVGQGDIAVVQYSGHGSRFPDSSKGAGYTETIVPFDSKLGNRTLALRRGEIYDITDTQVRERLLEPLARKTSHITFLFDSCHSGSILRGGPGGGRVRGLSCFARDTGVKIDGPKDGGHGHSWSPKDGQYVLLAACQADETAEETLEADYSKRHGAFTSELCLQIAKGHGDTWYTVVQRVTARLVSSGIQQHPLLEGAVGGMVLGTPTIDQPPSLSVFMVEPPSTIEIAGGSVLGVTIGSTYEVRLIAGGVPPFPVVTITAVSSFAAQAMTVSTDGIMARDRCFLLHHQYEAAALAVHFSHPVLGSFLPDDAMNIVCVVDDVKDAVVTIDREDIEGQSKWTVKTNDDRIVFSTLDVESLLDNLRKFSLRHHALSIKNVSSTKLVSLSVLRHAREADTWADVSSVDGPVFCDGDEMELVIKNTSKFKVWPYVLQFVGDGTVALRFPAVGGHEELRAGGTTVARMQVEITSGTPVSLADGTIPEVMKLFVAAQQLPLDLLTQGGYESSRGAIHILPGCDDTSRGGATPILQGRDATSRGVITTGVQALLSMLQSFRDKRANTGEEWETVNVPYSIKPAV